MFFIADAVAFDAKNEMLILTYWSKSLQWVAEGISRQSLNPNRQFHMYIYFNPPSGSNEVLTSLFVFTLFLSTKKESEIW